MEQDFSEVLDSVKESGTPVKDLAGLTHELTMVILTQALKGNVEAVAMKNRMISPGGLAAQLARLVQQVLTKPHDNAVNS